ncbi:Helix-turn-helix domain of alkylmercury lyase [Thiohalospira halophila DSM 15071]|uniref:Alkylmercury lyase n=1 Tax=Thiohalospira halophila DSM 15071 TaxID=1123397 RepID=A0A1I1V331_9GAMM|nr:organomercurial lyase [Thiohalospira halophila]SFD77447.1 Helix-turn-helix domain of alkylmercury lyase [Thiohalospira halophila DSM 15071]
MQPDLTHLTERLLPIFPDFGAEGRELVRPLFRRLAHGRPVEPAELAAASGWSTAAVNETLSRWWGIRYDEEGRINGFWGLDLEPTRHQLRAGERALFAWCAWDTLFLADLMGETLEVTSPCPASGETIHLRVGPDGIEGSPPAARLALTLPDPARARHGVREAFCCGVDFVTEGAAEPWCQDRDDRHLLTLDQGYDLGQMVWEALLAPENEETAMSDCCASPEPESKPVRKRPCPSCGETARSVAGRTVLHHLQQPWAQPDLAHRNLWFCESPACPTVYFDAEGQAFTQADLRTTVGQKASGADAPICYCFGVARGEATPEVRGFVEAMTRDGLCACEARNPAGRCCLRDFPGS